MKTKEIKSTKEKVRAKDSKTYDEMLLAYIEKEFNSDKK